jgi:hypothetical protein
MQPNDKYSLSIGAVFTPPAWATFAIEKFGLLEKWLAGKTILDPTMGEGNLLIALVEAGLRTGRLLADLPTQNLYGVELNKGYFDFFSDKIEKYNLNKNNFFNTDFFFLEHTIEVDIIFGNPPWQTFANLPENYKEIAKPLFFEYDLVGKAQDLLLGGSRMDIASLVVQKSIAKHLKVGGEAVFFMPLSLLLNDGANEAFRNYKVGKVNFALEMVYDFGTEKVFENVATRYGLVHFRRDALTQYPVPYLRLEQASWETFYARPLLHENAPLSVTTEENINLLETLELLTILPTHIPRQGVNTCGANDIFFFQSCEDFDENSYLLNSHIVLPKKFIYPLITSKNFKKQENATKWVLLPYKKRGKPLDWIEIEQYAWLKKYLLGYKTLLENRKGTMLNAYIRRGYWWVLLGVGKYNFAPYKVVWEAYGRNTFEPQIFQGIWQANQSLQCFIPCETEDVARKILAYLQNPVIEKYLRSLKMEGTMNWAQVGKIKSLFKIETF